MTIKIQSDDNRDTLRFLSAIKQALLLLDTLGQIQASVGGLSMSSKASTTFEVHAMLENYVRQIEYNQVNKWPST